MQRWLYQGDVAHSSCVLAFVFQTLNAYNLHSCWLVRICTATCNRSPHVLTASSSSQAFTLSSTRAFTLSHTHACTLDGCVLRWQCWALLWGRYVVWLRPFPRPHFMVTPANFTRKTHTFNFRSLQEFAVGCSYGKNLNNSTRFLCI